MKTEPQEAQNTTIPKGYTTFRIKEVDTSITSKKVGRSLKEVKTKQRQSERRNSQQEFGVASMMSKALRQSLSDPMMEICESYASGKLTAQFRSLAKLEEGMTGTRPLCLSKHGHHLNGFEFNPDAPYRTIFDAKYFVKSGSRKGHVILHFPAFVPDKAFSKPDNATNFKINARLVALSDFLFDPSEKSYRPKNDEMHGTFGSYESPMLPLLKIPTEPMTAPVRIAGNRHIPDDVGLFLVMAVSFYRYENGSFHHLPRCSAMQIHEVY